jgi:EAL domain-containing protein (putative c-di-GMP-specific phosphodiesterase class I)
VITRFDEVQTFARRLSALGCRFALDDFAAGFGTFHYVERLPFDYFKIDGDLTRSLVTSSTEQLVIGAIVGIAQGMGKQTIAKFVADVDTCGLLAKGGVDYVQGRYVGQPGPLNAGLPAM